MFTKTITYIDYNDVERTETFYFNLSKAELAEMELSFEGGLGEYLKKISETKDQVKIFKMFKELILKSYGEKSPDGRRFIKSEELSNAFTQTEAYSIFFSELMDSKVAAAFVNGIMPKDLIEEARKQGLMPTD